MYEILNFRAVAIFFKDISKVNSEHKYICGGTLVSSNKVVTGNTYKVILSLWISYLYATIPFIVAAHCMHPKFDKRTKQPNELRLAFGFNDLKDNLQPGRVIKPVSKVKIHEGWNSNTERYNDDIAVLYLENDIIFSRFISPICISESIGSVNEGFIAGLGKNAGSNSSHENILSKIKVKFYERADCYEKVEGYSNIGSKNTFCAGTSDANICSGDSGNGFMVQINGIFFLKGLLSSSQSDITGCSAENMAIYTDVSKYVNFIGLNDYGNFVKSFFM